MPNPGPGGSSTSLAATVAQLTPRKGQITYSWGGNLAPAAIAAYQPRGIFSPGEPLPPVDPAQVRAWDYPVGYNRVFTPRAYEPISFQELRFLAESHDITRLAIE